MHNQPIIIDEKTRDEIHNHLNDRWWKVPRRTRNRIMVIEQLNAKSGSPYHSYNKPYRSLSQWKHTFIKHFYQKDNYRMVHEIIGIWVPPINSYTHHD